MAIKRNGIWYVWPTINGSRLKAKKSTGIRVEDDPQGTEADDMAAALRMIHRWGFADLIDRLNDGDLSVPQLYAAYSDHNGPHEALRKLRQEHTDPSISDYVAEKRSGLKPNDQRVQAGFQMLVDLAPSNARISWLNNWENVQGLYAKAVKQGRKPNTVRRSLHRAVAELLKVYLGSRSAMLVFMDDVEIPGELDERGVMLNRGELRELIDSADEGFRPVILLAVGTGIDRKPMLKLSVRHWDQQERVLSVPDRKTRGRLRRLHLEPTMAAVLDHLAAGRSQSEQLVQLTEHQVRKRFEVLRGRMERKDLRWKDLRGIFATTAIMCAWSPKKLQRWLGHTNPSMTIRYMNQTPVGAEPAPQEVLTALGLDHYYGGDREAADPGDEGS